MLNWFRGSPNGKSPDGGGKKHKAHLGEAQSKFYFDEKLKRWRVEGEEDEAEADGGLNSPPKAAAGAAANPFGAGAPEDGRIGAEAALPRGRIGAEAAGGYAGAEAALPPKRRFWPRWSPWPSWLPCPLCQP